MNEETATAVPPSDTPIIATGGSYYRRMRFFVMAILIAAGIWFAYDGWINWPKLNADYDRVAALAKEAHSQGDKREVMYVEQLKDIPHHDDLAIRLQKILTFVLPILGISLCGWAVHNSRGEIVLTDAELRAPGHPPVPLDAIEAVDRRLWDRKDIAYVDYATPTAKGRIRLDAFVYDADPIVKIVDRLSALMQDEAAPEA